MKGGRKLVLLNELVLDISEFINYHPGGRFVLKTNTGRDISKYFYGGYCLEDNQGARPGEGYNHSNYARMIVEGLIVGVYQPETQLEVVTCQIDLKRTKMLNSSTGTIFLENKLKHAVPNFRNFYKGFKMMGKHFKIRSSLNRNVHRHYTICNTMQPAMYTELVECLT